MALQFTPPPDWLVKGYVDRQNLGQQTSETVNQAYQAYIQQKALQQKQANDSDEAYVKAFQAGGPDLANQIAVRRGIKNPPSIEPVTPPTVSSGTVPTPAQPSVDPMQGPPLPGVGLGLKTQQTPQSGLGAPSPIVQASLDAGHPNHADVKGYQLPTPEQMSKWANQGDYGQKKMAEAKLNLEMNKTMQGMEGKGPLQTVTKEQALASGTFDPGKQVMVEPPAPRLDISEKQSQFDQREWDKIVKDVSPATASTRTTLGMATKANFQADRALVTLSKPVVTVQEAGNAMADIAAIYQTGSPTQYGMSHQEYNTLYGKVQSALQSVTGKPQDALPDAIKQRLIEVLHDMKGTNAGVLKQQLDFTEKSKAKIIKKFPDEWKDIRATLEGNPQTAQAGSATIPATGPHGASVNQNGHTYNWNPRTGQYE